VSLAGPGYGAVGAAACWAIGEAIDSDLFRALAYAGFLINLINLIPIGILDGGSIWRALQLARHSVEAPPGQQFAMGSTYPIAVPGGGPSRAVQIGVLYGLLVTLLVLGMLATHVTQHRL
ncbi:MAG TPA: site-2 protease family protein, partial [Gaiellaceae bacterium]|nr:site-2 protease family protein [Gaiellaceae bacterium]